MQNRKIKKIFIMLLMLLCVMVCSNISFAADNFKFSNWDNVSGGADKATQNVMGTIVQVIRVVGTGVSIIMLTYIAIKYMMAAPSEKAEFKKSAVIFVFGAILVFASTNILSIIMDFADKNMVSTAQPAVVEENEEK